MTLSKTLKTSILTAAAGVNILLIEAGEALAQDSSVPPAAPELGEMGAGAAAAPSAGEAFMWNMGLVLILVAMFYLLLIRPQQKRFKEHAAMLDSLKKGDSVVTNGGLVGKVDQLVGNEEIVVDLGSGVKVSVLRSAIQTRKGGLPGKAANDAPKGEDKGAKGPAKKTTKKKK